LVAPDPDYQIGIEQSARQVSELCLLEGGIVTPGCQQDLLSGAYAIGQITHDCKLVHTHHLLSQNGKFSFFCRFGCPVGLNRLQSSGNTTAFVSLHIGKDALRRIIPSPMPYFHALDLLDCTKDYHLFRLKIRLLPVT